MNISQNQNTVEINRQIIHPRRNRNFQTPRVHFDIPQSPSSSTPENPISILPETPTLLSQRSISSLPSDYLGSTPTSEQIRENPFNPPNQTSRLPYWTTQSFTQGKSSITMRNRTTSYRNCKCNSDTLFKARATTVIGYKFTATFSEKKVHCSQVSNGNKNRLDHESFYQSNIERLLHLNLDYCKNELLKLNITRNKNTDRKIVNFQVFADSVHQAELERYHGHVKSDEQYPSNGAHGRLTYDMHDKHWIPHIGINDPSNCKADTKNKGYQEIMFFDWKTQLEKIQLTRDLSDNTMIYQGIRLPCKNDQGYCDHTVRTQATIVWFPEDTCTTFQLAKIHARRIKFHENYFIESIPYEQVNPSRKQSNYFRNIHDTENKLTHFHIYQETEFEFKYRNPLYKTQYSKILVECKKKFRHDHWKNKF